VCLCLSDSLLTAHCSLLTLLTARCLVLAAAWLPSAAAQKPAGSALCQPIEPHFCPARMRRSMTHAQTNAHADWLASDERSHTRTHPVFVPKGWGFFLLSWLKTRELPHLAHSRRRCVAGFWRRKKTEFQCHVDVCCESVCVCVSVCVSACAPTRVCLCGSTRFFSICLSLSLSLSLLLPEYSGISPFQSHLVADQRGIRARLTTITLNQ